MSKHTRVKAEARGMSFAQRAIAMTFSLSARMLRSFAVTFFVVALASPAWSQDERGYAKEGGFAGVSVLPGFTFDGVTFDGQSLYQEINGTEVAVLPRLDNRNLFRFMLGYRYSRASIEVSYERTHHGGSFLQTPAEATFQSVGLAGRLFFLTRGRVQPHLLLGASLPFFSVKDGSVLDTKTADARFRGYGMNSEAGVTLYVHRQLGVSVGYNYRLLWFDRLTGVNDRPFELKPAFRETSGTVVVTSHVIF